LDGGEGNEDPVIPPEVPGGNSVWQTVFHYPSDGQREDAPGVMAAGGCEVRKVHVEVNATGLAAMVGVPDLQVKRSVSGQAAEIVEDSAAEGVAIAATATAGAATPTVVPRPMFDPRSGQVLNAGNPFGGVREIFSGWHELLSSIRERLKIYSS
jgi:hypothetical protein